jgi:hydrogenase expression/formation protein HypD
VVGGFDPLDLLFSVYMIVKQLNEGKPRLENEYTRGVQWEGNQKAQRLINDVFDVVDGKWRGLGVIPKSTLALKQPYADYDAIRKHGNQLRRRLHGQHGGNLPRLGQNRQRPKQIVKNSFACPFLALRLKVKSKG